MKPQQIAVLFGGCTPEYGVSLQSAAAVLSHMDAARFAPVPIGITQQGEWFYYTGPVQAIADDTWHTPRLCTPAAVSPSRSARGLLVLHPKGVQTLPLDAAFPLLHGKNGEDGTVQGLFELAGIPVAGCGVLASALCMDKHRAHTLAQAAGVAVPAAFTLTRADSAAAAQRQAQALGFPVFVKPVRAGSSFGITKVACAAQLAEAVALAFTFDDTVIVEECICGFEVGCAILGSDVLTLGAVDEIELSDGFFNYTEKYTLETSSIHVPARIAPAKAHAVKEAAQAVYRALGCSGFARVDLFLDTQGRIVFNEVNTIPGFTAHSRYPGMMQAAGLSFAQVVEEIIAAAVRA